MVKIVKLKRRTVIGFSRVIYITTNKEMEEGKKKKTLLPRHHNIQGKCVRVEGKEEGRQDLCKQKILIDFS